jgi:hypothetical protein
VKELEEYEKKHADDKLVAEVWATHRIPS